MNTSAKNPKGDRECHKIIRDLRYQIKCCKAELDLVLHQLALCRARANQHSYNDQIKPLEHNVPSHAPTQNDQFEYSRIMQGNFVLACSCTCSSDDNNQVKNCIINNNFSSFEYLEQSHTRVNTSSLSKNETLFVTNSNDDDVDVYDALCCTTELEFDPQNREVREGVTMKVNEVSPGDPKEKPGFHHRLLL